ncbi:MAG TPA: DegT/DnrJ/EryC1/StrS family aminotransferase [Candidatus Bathyarchaeia archaeon]|nr:DegT/DnrJ/EryC1/StrS family aminotransferase [Candidatus Bathyarchaeia archaeon]
MWKRDVTKLKVQYDFDIGNAERRAVQAVLQGSKFETNEQKRELEKEFCEYIGTKYAVAVSSGTAGLHCALLAVGIKSGDEVLTVPNTHSTPPMCIMNTGAKPTFVDVDDDTLNMDASKIEEKITSNTKALLPVHSNGHPYDVDPIHEIARKHGLPIVEDAAQSLGAKYKGKRLGTESDVVVYSFARHKHVIAAGWGGVVLTNSEEIASTVRAYATQGRGKHYNQTSADGAPVQLAERSGYSYWLNEMSAAIARVQFKKFRQGPISVEKRRKVADRYNKLLKDVPSIQTPVEKDYAYHSYCRYVVRAKHRDKLYAYLTKRNIYVAIHYYTPIYKEHYYTDRYGPSENFPVTEKVEKEVLTLPSWATLTHTQQDFVVNSIKKFYRENP